MIIPFLYKLGALCVTRPWHIMACFGALILGALPLVMHLPLETDLRATLPEDIALALERRNRLFDMHDLALLLVQTEDKAPEDLIAFGEALARRLTASPLIRRVEFGYSSALLNMLNNVALDYAPLFVSPEQLENFDRLLTPQGLEAQLRKTLLQLNTIGSSARDLALQDDPLQVKRFAFDRFATLRGSFQFDTFSPYFLSKDGKALLLKVKGQALVDDMARARATVRLLRQVAQELLALPTFQGLTVHGTGSYFFATESESTIRRDLIRSISLAVIFICLLIAWAFRRWGVLVYGQIPTLVGLFIALGVFALLRPTLNSLTLGCSAALVGLGIDFTIHILNQCFAELSRGKATLEAIQVSVCETGSGLLLAATTTIAAFTAFLFSTQRFLQDMGLLAVLGIFFCLLLCLMLLPSLVACLPGKGGQPRPRAMGIPQLLSLILKAPLLILGLSLALCVGAAAALTLWPPGFETDLRNIYAADSPALQTQAKIAATFGGSQVPVTLMIEGPTEEQVLQTMQRLEPALQSMVGEGVLAAVMSPSTLVPAAKDQQVMLHLLRNTNPTAFATLLTRSLDEAGFDVNALQSYITRIHNALTLKTPLDLSTLKTLGFGELLRPFLSHDDAEAAGLVTLFPKRDLWTLEASTAFSRRIGMLLTELGLHNTVTDLYTLSPDATAQIGKDFRNITLLALVLIVTAICLQFRKPLLIGLVFLPVVCGLLWTAGVFALCGWKLNFMNIAMLPMLLGIGIDDGIHIVHRFHTHGSRDVQEALQFTGIAVLLTSLTTLLAFGSLTLSATQGIVSVGLISLTGVTACLLASLFTLPASLHVWERKRTHDTQAVDPCN